MLLTHTSTLSDASGSLSALKGTAARQRLAGSGYTGGKPGELSSWSYNNYGFSVLGMTLERAADQVLDDVLGEAVLTPMGIDAAFEAGSVDDTGLLCALYYPGNSLSRTVSTQKSYVCIQQPGYRGNFFAGGFTCSAGELAQLVAMLAEGRDLPGPAVSLGRDGSLSGAAAGPDPRRLLPVPPPALPGKYVWPGSYVLPHRLGLRLLRPAVL